MLWLVLVHFAATWFMVGLIWFVQIVHYPLFARVDEARFAAYEVAHTARTSWVVVPPMLAELAATVFLVMKPPPGVALWSVWAGAVMLAIVWASTAAFQVPAHTRLTDGFDAAVHRRLVHTNWIRTLAWSARGALAAWIVVCAVSPAR